MIVLKHLKQKKIYKQDQKLEPSIDTIKRKKKQEENERNKLDLDLQWLTENTKKIMDKILYR